MPTLYLSKIHTFVQQIMHIMNLETFIDHTYLKSDINNNIVDSICSEAIQYNFKSVCLPLCVINRAQELLKDTSVLLCTVLGFPLGYQSLHSKLQELEEILQYEVNEVDMVINLNDFKNNALEKIHEEIACISKITNAKKLTLKVIIEIDLLDNQEIITICNILKTHPIQFVKTSTGFIGQGATIDAVSVMRASLPSHISIKASGGIKTLEQCRAIINAGASRIGTSNGVAIMKTYHQLYK